VSYWSHSDYVCRRNERKSALSAQQGPLHSPKAEVVGFLGRDGRATPRTAFTCYIYVSGYVFSDISSHELRPRVKRIRTTSSVDIKAEPVLAITQTMDIRS